MVKQESAPWYVKPTLWNRYGPSTWISRLMGLPLPGEGGEKYSPKGYKISEVGPEMMRGKGTEFLKAEKERLARVSDGGCPFHRRKIE